jgi:hypothetical protein
MEARCPGADQLLPRGSMTYAPEHDILGSRIFEMPAIVFEMTAIAASIEFV